MPCRCQAPTKDKPTLIKAWPARASGSEVLPSGFADRECLEVCHEIYLVDYPDFASLSDLPISVEPVSSPRKTSQSSQSSPMLLPMPTASDTQRLVGTAFTFSGSRAGEDHHWLRIAQQGTILTHSNSRNPQVPNLICPFVKPNFNRPGSKL